MRGEPEQAGPGQVECECPHCECRMDIRDAIHREGKYYCDESCANGHQEKAGCDHPGCNCGREDNGDLDWM